MGCSGLLILGLVLNVAHCLETPGHSGDAMFETRGNITAVLGEDAYLSCRYVGESRIQKAVWRRQINSRTKSKALAGITTRGPFRSAHLSEPDSVTNLTVRMSVSSVDLEGEYICEFESEEEDSFFDSTFVTIIARPDVQVLVAAETVNGTHYQSVSCSAVGGRPAPQMRWLIHGRPVAGDPFTVTTSTAPHSNGTSTLRSVLRFPTHLQDADAVTCEVRHPALPSPELATARVETYARPNVTIKAVMVQRGGSDFWVVSCLSSGGRPESDISVALNGDEGLQTENDTDSGAQRRSVYLPVTRHEGHNVTCVFEHPKFTQRETRGLTLPYFHLSGARLMVARQGINGRDPEGNKCLELQEEQTDVVIGLQVNGNVPRYNLTCKKDDGPLPGGVELIGSNLTLRAPVERLHAGLYECVFSYHRLRATLQLNVTVKPRVLQPVEPVIKAHWRAEDGRRKIECSAADAVPEANVSWLLPEGVSGDSWFNFTSHNGSHSVRGVVLLPACFPRELTAVCVINHPAFEQPENRSVTLPRCARPNVTVNLSTEWKGGQRYTTVDCSVDSVAPAANLTWHLGTSDDIIGRQTDVRVDGLAFTRSSVQFLSASYPGQNVTCTVEHPSLQEPENMTILIPVHKAPELRVSVMRQPDSRLWLATCECTAEDERIHLAWILPQNVKGQTSLQSEIEGRATKARLSYQFSLESHEGQDLTCVYRFEHGTTETRRVHVPKYHIFAVRVLNHTAPLRSHRGEPLVQRVSLEENLHNQKILLQVEGNVPQYELSCKRGDGSFAHMEGLAMVFQSAITEQDEGLYTCTASFYHHRAEVRFQVEVMSEVKLLSLVTMISVSSGTSILLILTMAVWLCCKINSKTQYKKQESLSALTTLMQEPGSPEVRKLGTTEQDSKEYAHLVSYSIVIDQKSTV